MTTQAREPRSDYERDDRESDLMLEMKAAGERYALFKAFEFEHCCQRLHLIARGDVKQSICCTSAAR